MRYSSNPHPTTVPIVFLIAAKDTDAGRKQSRGLGSMLGRVGHYLHFVLNAIIGRNASIVGWLRLTLATAN